MTSKESVSRSQSLDRKACLLRYCYVFYACASLAFPLRLPLPTVTINSESLQQAHTRAFKQSQIFYYCLSHMSCKAAALQRHLKTGGWGRGGGLLRHLQGRRGT